jgi:hypothetical protein
MHRFKQQFASLQIHIEFNPVNRSIIEPLPYHFERHHFPILNSTARCTSFTVVDDHTSPCSPFFVPYISRITSMPPRSSLRFISTAWTHFFFVNNVSRNSTTPRPIKRHRRGAMLNIYWACCTHFALYRVFN